MSENRDGGEERGGGEGNFQVHGLLLGSFLSSADRETHTTRKLAFKLTLVDMIAAGHTALVCPCMCPQMSVCVSLMHKCTCSAPDSHLAIQQTSHSRGG